MKFPEVRLAMIVALTILAAVGLTPAVGLAQNEQPLRAGQVVPATISGDAVHAYTVQARPNDLIRFIAEQKGVDVVLVLVAPGGAKVTEVDSPTGTNGPEEMTFIAEAGGAYRIEVRRLAQEPNPKSGHYEARLVEVRPATRAELDRAADEKTLAKLELVWDEAARTQDAEALGRLTTDDFLYFASWAAAANASKTQQMAVWAAGRAQSKDVIARNELDETSMRVFGDMAVAMGRAVLMRTEKGRTTKFRGRFVHVWQKRGSTWLMAADHFYPTDPLPVPHTATTVAPATLASYAGIYDIADGPIVDLAVAEDGLVLTAQGDTSGWKRVYQPESPTEFFATPDDAQLVFVRDEKGAVQRLLLIDSGRVNRASKVVGASTAAGTGRAQSPP
jgi:ketosteroid isomerase-like protein